MKEIEFADWVSVNEYSDGEIISISRLDEDYETREEIFFTREAAKDVLKFLDEIIGEE